MSVNEKIVAVVLGIGLAVPVMGAAQTTAQPASAPAPAKVGIVAIQQAIAATNEGKKELDGLQKRFAPKQAELKSLNDELENLKKQLQTQGDKLSEEARATQTRSIEIKQKTFERKLEDTQNEYQQAQQDILGRLGPKMAKVLENYALKNGYSVILDVSNPQTPVLYASQNTNISKEIVDAYNAQFPSAEGAGKTSGAVTQPKSTGANAAAQTAKTGSAPAKRP